MKKLIFLFTLVFAVSMVMAQGNVSTVTETGDNNEATVNQTGATNTSGIIQINHDQNI